MGVISKIRGWFKMLLGAKAKEEFDVEYVSSAAVDSMIDLCVRIYSGYPYWVNAEDHIKTVNFAKSVCSETARLATMGIGIHVAGSNRAEWIQKQIDRVYYQLRHWVEFGCAYGTVILKPNGKTIDLYTRTEFEITHQTGDVIDGVVFQDQQKIGKKWYTKLEYHRFENGLYRITNKCYVGDTAEGSRKPINIDETPWAEIAEDATARNVSAPIFAVFRTPHANNIAPGSPYALPIFSDAIEELKDLDIAYSRNAKEILDSKRTVLLDADRVLAGKEKTKPKSALDSSIMPDYIKLVDGVSTTESDIYHEINPDLNTDTRLTGINALLSQIGYKVGFSNGYFVFNESTGIQTATGVEAEQQRTIQFIKDVRDKLENCLGDLIYALSVMADLYGYAPAGTYEVVYDFGDLTYNRDEDRARWWGYVVSGKVPAWMFFVKFEGMTEKDAKSMTQEAQPATPALFSGGGVSEDPEDTAEVQNKSLNGAQTQSLIAIMSQYSAGEITEGQAVNLISTAIGISKEDARKILNGDI